MYTKDDSPREGTSEDNSHVYEISLTLLVMQAEEHEPEPLENVADAVKTLLEDNAEWLLEAIGHPGAGAFQVVAKAIKVSSGGPRSEGITVKEIDDG